MYRYENTGSVYRRPKIPRQGSSPDFDHRCFSLPGFPVVLSGPSLLQQWALSQPCTAFPFQYKRITISCYMKLWIQ